MDAAAALEIMHDLADQAGVIMLDGVGQPAETKGDGTPVTASDLEINELVVSTIQNQYPDCGVIGEEGSYNSEADHLFVVDPIDGTYTFTAGLGLAVFAIAYLEDGITTAALIYDPFADMRFAATRGRGTTLNGQPITVGDIPRQRFVYVEAANRSRLEGQPYEQWLRRAGFEPARCMAFIGPAARVATGATAGGVFARKSLWDALAVALIVTEAGGIATDLDGVAVRGLDLGEGILVAHPTCHNQILAALAGPE